MIATGTMRLSLAAAPVLVALVALVFGSCGPYSSEPAGPRTAAERAAAERAASTEEPVPEGKAWGGWRYQGKRDDCFYVVERECFATLAEACEATTCEHGCDSRGAGPAIVHCKQ
jgi:hypothetical protein